MSRLSRSKGKRGELAVCDLLRAVCPEVRTKRAGGESSSFDRGRDLLGTPGLCVQVKEMLAPRPILALSEAMAACPPNEIALAFVKQTLRGSRPHKHDMRGRWCVTLLAEDLVGLLAMALVGLTTMRDNAPRLAQDGITMAGAYKVAAPLSTDELGDV